MKSNSHLIFIVDDDPDDRQIILDAFLERSPQIDYVFIENAETLLDTLYSDESEFPALILLDLNMPVMDGYEATRHLRARGETLPIIALTASLPAEVEKDVQKAGLTDIVVKPFNPDELFRVILTYVK